MDGFGIKPGLFEVAVIVSVWFSLVVLVEMLERFMVWLLAFSLMPTFASAFKVGVWFMELMVTVNVRETMLLLVVLLFTVTVIVEELNAKAAGVKVSELVVFGVV